MSPVNSAVPSSPVCEHISSREIWSLTWPQALMMLLQFLVGFTDVVVAGYIHPHAQGALGIVFQCQIFLMVIGFALVNGGLAAMSQSIGANLPARASRYAGLLLKLTALCSLFALGLGLLFRRELLVLLGVPQAIFPLTEELWGLLLFIMPASYLSFATVAVFRSRKNVWVPLASAAVVCIINTVADLGLGLGWFGMPELGARGLVWASIFSVTAGGLFNFYILLKRKIISSQSFAPWRWEKKAFPYILKVALPAGGSQLLWQLGYLVLYLITNTLPGDSVSATAGLTAGLRIEALLFLPGMAFSFTASILVGHCLGASNRKEAKRVGLRIISAGTLSMTLLAALLMPFRNEIAGVVAPDPAVAEVASAYLMFNLIATPFTVTSMIMGGLFTGAGATLFSLTAFSIGNWVVRLPLAWYVGHIVWQTPAGVFVAMLISQVVQSGICICLFLRADWYRFSSTAKRFKKG